MGIWPDVVELHFSARTAAPVGKVESFSRRAKYGAALSSAFSLALSLAANAVIAMITNAYIFMLLIGSSSLRAILA